MCKNEIPLLTLILKLQELINYMVIAGLLELRTIFYSKEKMNAREEVEGWRPRLPACKSQEWKRWGPWVLWTQLKSGLLLGKDLEISSWMQSFLFSRGTGLDCKHNFRHRIDGSYFKSKVLCYLGERGQCNESGYCVSIWVCVSKRDEQEKQRYINRVRKYYSNYAPLLIYYFL